MNLVGTTTIENHKNNYY